MEVAHVVNFCERLDCLCFLHQNWVAYDFSHWLCFWYWNFL